MNVQHLLAFCWLRWRLLVNQMKKGGIVNTIFLTIFAVGAILGSLGLLVGGFVVGFFVFALPDIPPLVLLYTWDGLVVVFLFAWCIGLLTELQHSEALSLEKFLHLPVSLGGVFVLNYLSSLLSVNLIVFAPMIIGFNLGLVFSKGPGMLLVLPLLAAFFLMVTALTYQFQGWLASLMVNKRRRRTIIVMVTLGFVLLCQLPNVANLYFQPWNVKPDDHLKEQIELNELVLKKEITFEEFHKRQKELQDRGGKGAAGNAQKRVEEWNQSFEQVGQIALVVNVILPIGWLPLGAWAASEGSVLPALLGTLGLALLGIASLWRAYRTTLRLYTGQFTAGQKTAPLVAKTPAAPALPIEQRPGTLLENAIPGLSEQATVVALATFRSLLRAPEAKMLLLSPLFMVVIFGGIFLRGSMNVPELLRPLITFGAMSMILFFTLMQLVGNQFGFDRSGFKVYVLSPAPREEILLGKNLAVVPMILVLTAPVIVLVQLMMPLRLDFLFAIPLQLLSMFLLFCLAANMMSIFAPMPMAAGTLKPVNPKMLPMLFQMLFVFALPLAMTPTLIPWAIAAGLEWLQLSGGMPICVVLSLLECAAIAVVYRFVLTWQARLLEGREQRILEIVTTKAE